MDQFQSLAQAVLEGRHALDHLQEGVSITDPHQKDNPLVYVNDSFLELTGYERSEVEGQNCRFLQGEETDPKTLQSIRDAVIAQKPISVELINYKKDGTPFWNFLTISPVYNDQEEVTHFVAIQRDVSYMKNLQSELERKQSDIDQLMESLLLLRQHIKEQEDAIASFIMKEKTADLPS